MLGSAYCKLYHRGSGSRATGDMRADVFSFGPPPLHSQAPKLHPTGFSNQDTEIKMVAFLRLAPPVLKHQTGVRRFCEESIDANSDGIVTLREFAKAVASGPASHTLQNFVKRLRCLTTSVTLVACFAVYGATQKNILVGDACGFHVK